MSYDVRIEGFSVIPRINIFTPQIFDIKLRELLAQKGLKRLSSRLKSQDILNTYEAIIKLSQERGTIYKMYDDFEHLIHATTGGNRGKFNKALDHLKAMGLISTEENVFGSLKLINVRPLIEVVNDPNFLNVEIFHEKHRKKELKKREQIISFIKDLSKKKVIKESQKKTKTLKE